MSYEVEAEALFRAVAKRHSLEIVKSNQSNIELLMTVPKQSGLSFDLTLGLQNLDELNIGIGRFWSYFFPYQSKANEVDFILDGIVYGACRLRKLKQFGKIRRQYLEVKREEKWEAAYATMDRFSWPFFSYSSEIISNKDRVSKSESVG